MQGLQQYGKYGLCALLLSAGLLGSSLAESGEESGLALSPGPGKFTAVTLRCENLVNPLGIGETAPRLSWQLAAPERGQRQAAYHILVASSARLLDAGTGDLWDSGKVTSDETIGIVYGGKKLASHQRCFWKVRVWDKNDQPSDWTERAMWSMGLLDRSDWHAEWIGYDKLRQVELPDAPFGNAMWIWHAADPNRKAPKGHRLFLSQLELPQDFKIEKAELLVTADDAFKFVINTQLVAVNGAGGFKQPQMVDVTQHLRPGANSLRVEVENGAEGPAGLLARLVISAADGRTALHLSDRSWKSTDRPGANWHNREIDSSDWPAAVELGEHGAEPWGRLKYAPLSLPPPAYLRTSFRVDKHVQRATLYATALGVFDVHVNGHRVSDDYFNPGWTDYTKRVYYRTYDVSDLIRSGENVFGAILADGWYSGYIGWKRIRDHYGKLSRFGGQINVEYADGSMDVVGTGSSWRASMGSIQEADFLMGETNDARLEQRGWDRAGFDDGSWEPVDTGAEMQPLLQSHPGPPVRAIGEFRAKSIHECGNDVYVLDLGQNFAGVTRLKVTGSPGQKITLRFAERLNPDGTLYTTNLRDARATDTYICRGEGIEVWQPRFTFHGFQYVEIVGLRAKPTEESVVGVALSSDTPVVGKFKCSDQMLNLLHNNIYWTQRANFIDIPTDCPQRDERLGWTGDAQVYIRTATLNTDVQAFFTKWLVDLEDGQRSDGQFPMVAPVKVAESDGGPAWADAGVICPWTIYEVYGDRRVLEKHYDAMTRFISFCKHRGTPLLPPEKFHCFGDWLSIKADTPKDVIYTAYFAYSSLLTARAAEALGKSEEAAQYRELYEAIKGAFNEAYVAEDGRIKGNTQACYVLALAFDLLDESKRKLASQYLIEDIESRGGHLSTGFIGTKDLMLVLSKIGRNDVAYRLLHNDSFPSWGFSIKHGATSIWERWDGWTPEHGFQDPGMNSFAHYSFGAVYQWIVENVGGIRSDGPSYKRITIAPQPSGHLTSARVTFDSVRGTIETAWEIVDGKFLLDVQIPPNTSATILLPGADGAEILEGGRSLDASEGVRFLRYENGRAVLAAEPGHYQFQSER